ncbi:MAG: hypothetical protein H0U66_05330 [Gemmatimonadaceae bacterium]|nr:hypothetical protein [Gemmatimonadaceae bacterium]
MGKKNLGAGFAMPAENARTPVSEEGAKSFISKSGHAPALPGARQRSSRLRRAQAEDTERLNVHVPIGTANRVRERAVKERRSLSDAVTEALDSWLKSRPA